MAQNKHRTRHRPVQKAAPPTVPMRARPIPLFRRTLDELAPPMIEMHVDIGCGDRQWVCPGGCGRTEWRPTRRAQIVRRIVGLFAMMKSRSDRESAERMLVQATLGMCNDCARLIIIAEHHVEGLAAELLGEATP